MTLAEQVIFLGRQNNIPFLLFLPVKGSRSFTERTVLDEDGVLGSV
jgi:hypothetical protein